MNKSVLTNLTAVLITFIGLFPIYNEIIFFTGLFALSGSITNWLAVYMLFDKVPFIYGSGVIPRNFIIFKAGIRNIVINEFFAGDNFEKFVRQNNESLKTKIETNLNFEKVFLKLTDAIEESSLGGLLPEAYPRAAVGMMVVSTSSFKQYIWHEDFTATKTHQRYIQLP